MNPTPRRSSFQDAILTEAVQTIEQTGPLEDAQAMREAMALRDDGPGRIAERARILGARIGLVDELARGRAWAPWVLAGMVALIVFAGLALAGDVIGGAERRINVVVALASLLGLHLLTLCFWLLGLVLPTGSFNLSFGWLWLALTARVAGGRRGQAPVLLRAGTRLLHRARLLPWALGFVSHAVWTLSFATALVSLVFALAFRHYRLDWETTILDPGFFVHAVAWLGVAPSWLGFPLPDVQAVLAPQATAAGQRAWALWLTGCVVAYGLLPRLLLAMLCAAVWHERRKRLQPDLSQPCYRALLARFEALAPRSIVDADHGAPPRSAASGLALDSTTDELLAVGFELPDETPWPPEALQGTGARMLRIDGSAGARRDLLDTLAHEHPRRVLIVCRAASSPDRGTERFVREVIALCGECRLWLHGAGADAAALARWQAWLADTGLGLLRSGTVAGDVLEGWRRP